MEDPQSASSGKPADAHRLVPLWVLLPEGDGACWAATLLLLPLGPGRSCVLVGGCDDTDCDKEDEMEDFTESGVLEEERKEICLHAASK